MATLMIMIREPADSGAAAQTLRPVVCPYLAALAGNAAIMAERRLRELKEDGDGHLVTMLDVIVDEARVKDLAEVARPLERFLKQTAKDAGLSASFGILRAEECADEPHFA